MHNEDTHQAGPANTWTAWAFLRMVWSIIQEEGFWKFVTDLFAWLMQFPWEGGQAIDLKSEMFPE
jgi:hypothetical protein